MNSKKRALGKGLSALLNNTDTDFKSSRIQPNTGNVFFELSIKNIEINPFQPRKSFDKEALIDLAESIKENGIIQPITVRKIGNDKYQIISGERRFRAAQLTELSTIPSYVRVANDKNMLEMAIVENVQRENLNALDVALSFQRLIEECSLTQELLSQRIGKSRSTVTNFLRLLKLPIEIQSGLREQKISMGHARALINIDNEVKQIRVYKDIINKKLSVRQVESLLKNLSKPDKANKSTLGLSEQETEVKNRLSEMLDKKVKIKKLGKKGSISIPYHSPDDLSQIMLKLGL